MANLEQARTRGSLVIEPEDIANLASFRRIADVFKPNILAHAVILANDPMFRGTVILCRENMSKALSIRDAQLSIGSIRKITVDLPMTHTVNGKEVRERLGNWLLGDAIEPAIDAVWQADVKGLKP